MITDTATMSNRPLKHLGNGAYGCVYVTKSPVYGVVYFDHSDWAGIAENETPEFTADQFAMTFNPNPTAALARLTSFVNTLGSVKIAIYGAPGEMVANFQWKKQNWQGYIELFLIIKTLLMTSTLFKLTSHRAEKLKRWLAR